MLFKLEETVKVTFRERAFKQTHRGIKSKCDAKICCLFWAVCKMFFVLSHVCATKENCQDHRDMCRDLEVRK